MKDRDATLYAVLFCVVLVLGWTFVIYAPLRAEARHAVNMVSREQNRI